MKKLCSITLFYINRIYIFVIFLLFFFSLDADEHKNTIDKYFVGARIFVISPAHTGGKNIKKKLSFPVGKTTLRTGNSEKAILLCTVSRTFFYVYIA